MCTLKFFRENNPTTIYDHNSPCDYIGFYTSRLYISPILIFYVFLFHIQVYEGVLERYEKLIIN
jgi:hypothetical protein